MSRNGNGKRARQQVLLPLEIYQKDGWWFALDPKLHQLSQGRTPEQAVERIQEEIFLLLQLCQERGNVDGFLAHRYSIWQSRRNGHATLVEGEREYRQVPFTLPAGIRELAHHAPLPSA